MLPPGFVYLHDYVENFEFSLRYFGEDNFVGAKIDGYEREVVIVTKETAIALSKVQLQVNSDGFNLVVYDSYRPQRAVNHFIRWTEDETDQKTKSWFYPNIEKSKIFELGYLSKRSGHSRGSTIDLSLIEQNKNLHKIAAHSRKLLDNSEITFLDDGSLDMGSSFDLLDSASHYENNLISAEHKERRNYLKDTMVKHGFKPYSKEWWHFTLENEPFPDIFFDFPVF